MNTTKSTLLEGLTVQRKLTGEVFTITGKDGSFFQLNGGADKGGRDVLGSELSYYTRVNVCDCKRVVSTVTPFEQAFVLADVFDVEAMSLDIPDHVLESDPSLEWVTCPCCDGERFVEVERNGWVSALFSDSRRALAYRNLNSSYKMCGRCSGVGEVLDNLPPFDEQNLFDEQPTSSNKSQALYDKKRFDEHNTNSYRDLLANGGMTAERKPCQHPSSS
jgi:hypothetical protein